MYNVFVYGTLKAGYGNSYLLKDSTQLGKAISAESFRMKQVGFPALFRNDDTEGNELYGKVVGEIYEVNDRVLNSLDILEGNGTMYQREEHQFTYWDGKQDRNIVAWVYLATGNFRKRIYSYDDIIPNENGELIWAGGSSATSKPTVSKQAASG